MCPPEPMNYEIICPRSPTKVFHELRDFVVSLFLFFSKWTEFVTPCDNVEGKMKKTKKSRNGWYFCCNIIPDLARIERLRVDLNDEYFSVFFGIFPKYFREKPKNFTPPKKSPRSFQEI